MKTSLTVTLHGRTRTCASGESIRSKPLMTDTRRQLSSLIGVYPLDRWTETGKPLPLRDFNLIKSEASSDKTTITDSIKIRVKEKLWLAVWQSQRIKWWIITNDMLRSPKWSFKTLSFLLVRISGKIPLAPWLVLKSQLSTYLNHKMTSLTKKLKTKTEMTNKQKRKWSRRGLRKEVESSLS